jgi:dTDP-4-dehydrorhamnose reductase
MKIFIVGGSGVIGSYFVKSFAKENSDITYTYYKNKVSYTKGINLDVQDRDDTLKTLKKFQPDLIIIANALTGIDFCEANPSLAESINVKGTKNIVDGCKSVNSKLVFISTSAVFNGTKSEYSENDKPNPTGIYGLTKFQGEKIIQESNLPFLILRTDQPYCWKEKWQHTNSVIRVIENLEKNQQFKEVVDWYNTPTYVPDFVNATKELIQKDLEGIFHLVGSDFISRYDWSQKVADIFHLKKNLIKPIDSSELKLPVERNNVKLNNNKLFQKIGYRMLGVDDGLQRMSLDSIS